MKDAEQIVALFYTADRDQTTASLILRLPSRFEAGFLLERPVLKRSRADLHLSALDKLD